MSEPAGGSDVVVVGGGVAGLIAARELSHVGLSVTLVEARERLGGRIWRRSFAGTQRTVEVGGAWFSTRDMRPLAAELERYGLEVEAAAPPRAYRWLTGGIVRDGAPLPRSEGRALERAIYALGVAAREFAAHGGCGGREPGGLAELDVSAAAWIDALALPPATRDLLLTFAAMYGGAHPREVALLAHLSDIAAFGASAYALLDGLDEQLADGSGQLVARLAEDCGAELVLGAPVAAVQRHAGGGVRVRCDGPGASVYEAHAVILALPLGALAAVALDPPADPLIDAAVSAGQPCHSIKLWMLAADVPAGILAAGWGAPLQWVSDVGELDGARLLVAFGFDRTQLDPASADSAQEALRRFVPGARVLAVDHHDWSADRFARGAWGMWRPGWFSDGTLLALSTLHDGPLAYASSDFAPAWPGWIAGAISSGRHAAELIRRRLRA